jgi:hypothetical protein
MFFSMTDIFWFPVCLAVLYYILKKRADSYQDPWLRQIYYRAFAFKVICVIAFTMITAFYFKGGDTALYYQASKDMKAAIADDPDNFWELMKSSKLSFDSPLFNFFLYDNYAMDITYAYMLASNNFLPPKLAVIPSYLFGGSYISLNLVFGFFALAGSIRLFKSFYYFFPSARRELAFACLFLPGVAFWSAGLLKDPITFGCMGFMLYAFINIFYRKRKYASSIAWLLICGYFLFTIKIYILLVLVFAIMFWVFAEINRLIRDKTLRNIFTVMTIGLAIGAGIGMLTYVTTFEQAQQFKLDTLIGSIEKERQEYDRLAQYQDVGSNFSINSSNPVLLFLNAIVATFFRPFLWEISSPIVLLSALESLLFLVITLIFFIKKGVGKFFSIPYSDGRLMFCLVFAFAFAVAVGSATGNFGTLSRYKIPCTPFYLILIFLLYGKTNLKYPKWLNAIIDFAVPKKLDKQVTHVRHSRVYQPQP